MVNVQDNLFQRDEPRRVRRTDTRSTVLDRLVGDGEFTQVMSDHFGLMVG
jgi:hypothetical protein